MKNLIYICLIIFTISCSETTKPSYHFPGELNSPVLFANGAITTTNGISFSNNGLHLYISKAIEKTFENGKQYMSIFKHTYKNNKWDKAELVQLGINIDAYHPVLSIDNTTLFFNSRSHPDSTNVSIPHNIWFSKKMKKGWSLPKMVAGINSSSYDSYPSLAKNNNLYFNSDREGGKGGMDIYVSHFINGKYQKPINIQILNSDQSENDLVIDPDEKFIIFNRYINSTKEIDLYISFRKKDKWQKSVKLDMINSPNKWELTPTLSPDGKYFFYELDGKIMQIDLMELLKIKKM